MGVLKLNNHYTKILTVLMISTLISCEGFEPLTFQKENLIGNNLKTNGYFYSFTDKIVDTGKGTKYYEAFILYRSGVYSLVTSGSYSPTLNNIAKIELVDFAIKDRVKNEHRFINLQPNWGVFKVSGSNITIERWLTGNGQAYPVQTLNGKILNDSTINFYQQIGDESSSQNSKKKTYVINETYHFRQFSPKPDSTNKFIK